MFNQVGYGRGSAVQPDIHDERDFRFEELDAVIERLTTERGALPRSARKAVKKWQRQRRKLVVHPEWTCEDFRELTDTSWHQRGEECTGFALAAIADYHLRTRYIESRARADRKHNKGAGPDEYRTPLTAADWTRIPHRDREKLTVSRRMMYEMAQIYDRETWRTGSTLRGALKGWRDSGVAAATAWPYEPGDEDGTRYGGLSLKRVIDSVGRPGAYYLRVGKNSVEDMKQALAMNYPLFVNARLHAGWYDLFLPSTEEGDRDPAADDGATWAPTARIGWAEDTKVLGGHAFVIVGYGRDGWRIHNSWGPQWGDGGYAVLPYEDWARHGQDVWFVFPPAERRRQAVSETTFLTGSEVAAEDEQLARAEADLLAAESELVVAIAASDDEGVAVDAETARDRVAAGEAAVAAATADVGAATTLIAASNPRASLYSDMWRHVITMDDDGRLLPLGTKYGLNKASLLTMLWMFRRQTEHWRTRRLAIFADAGYWSPTCSIEQLQPLRDALFAAEIYPVFLVWDTPWYADMQGWLYGNANVRPDTVIPKNNWYFSRPSMLANAAEFPAPRMWKQIERRAHEASRREDGAGRLLADAIHYNRTKKDFEIHLIGYGAGDLVLPDLAALLPPVASCNLWAPATTMEQFRTSYATMLDSGHLGHLTIQAMDPSDERDCQMGPLPGSLLELVSDVLAVKDLDVERIYDELSARGFPLDPEPVLGLDRYLAVDPDVNRLVLDGKLDVRPIELAAPAEADDRAKDDAHIRLITAAGVHATTVESIRAELPERRPARRPEFGMRRAADPLSAVPDVDVGRAG